MFDQSVSTRCRRKTLDWTPPPAFPANQIATAVKPWRLIGVKISKGTTPILPDRKSW